MNFWIVGGLLLIGAGAYMLLRKRKPLEKQILVRNDPNGIPKFASTSIRKPTSSARDSGTSSSSDIFSAMELDVITDYDTGSDFKGQGGSFGGAGASHDYGSSSSDSSSSSSDSGGGDGGGGGGD